MEKKSAAERIRAARDGMSRAKFSEKYGIPLRTIEDWEAGKRTPPEYVIELIERVVRMDELNK